MTANPVNFDKLKQKWAQERHIRQEISLQRIARLRQIGPAIFQKYGIRKVVLFGSVLAQRADDHSDTDLLVLPLPLAQTGDFRRELEAALEFTLDLYTDHDDAAFVTKILARGEVFYDV